MSPNPYPRLLGDVTGSHVRFALETAPGVLEDIDTLPCGDYPTLAAAMQHYLDGVGTRAVHHAAVRLPPALDNALAWLAHTRQTLGLSTLLLLDHGCPPLASGADSALAGVCAALHHYLGEPYA